MSRKRSDRTTNLDLPKFCLPTHTTNSQAAREVPLLRPCQSKGPCTGLRSPAARPWLQPSRTKVPRPAEYCATRFLFASIHAVSWLTRALKNLHGPAAYCSVRAYIPPYIYRRIPRFAPSISSSGFWLLVFPTDRGTMARPGMVPANSKMMPGLRPIQKDRNPKPWLHQSKKSVACTLESNHKPAKPPAFRCLPPSHELETCQVPCKT